MMSRSRRYRPRPRTRRYLSRTRFWSLPLAAGLTVAGAVTLAFAGSGGPQAVSTAADSGGALSASYQTVTSWGTGYTGQFTITNGGAAAVSGWTLAFRLPSGT